jgi:hypothetical protein
LRRPLERWRSKGRLSREVRFEPRPEGYTGARRTQGRTFLSRGRESAKALNSENSGNKRRKGLVWVVNGEEAGIVFQI